MSTPALSDGSIFAKRYKIVRCLARGGMGAVYEVIHLDTKRRRALKAMHSHILHSEELRERFHREARVAAEVESDFIVDVFDTGVDEETQMPFLCMELLRGEELSRRIKKLGRIPNDEAALFLHQTALALDKTHQAGIVHRDLKPENLFITEREDGPPRVKVLDFGIAKVIADGATSAAATLSIGTPLYMSPEQFTPRARLNGASDIYALGMIAYTCLVGAAYWEEESRVGNVFAFGAIARMGPSEAASARAAKRGVTLPAGFDEWFARITNVDVEARFSPATAATRALAEILGVPLASGARSLGSPQSGRDVGGTTPSGLTPHGVTPHSVTPHGATPPSTAGSSATVPATPSAMTPAPAAAPAREQVEMPQLFEDQDDKTLVYEKQNAAAEVLKALELAQGPLATTQIVPPAPQVAKAQGASAQATPAPAPTATVGLVKTLEMSPNSPHASAVKQALAQAAAARHAAAAAVKPLPPVTAPARGPRNLTPPPLSAAPISQQAPVAQQTEPAPIASAPPASSGSASIVEGQALAPQQASATSSGAFAALPAAAHPATTSATSSGSFASQPPSAPLSAHPATTSATSSGSFASQPLPPSVPLPLSEPSAPSSRALASSSDDVDVSIAANPTPVPEVPSRPQVKFSSLTPSATVLPAQQASRASAPEIVTPEIAAPESALPSRKRPLLIVAVVATFLIAMVAAAIFSSKALQPVPASDPTPTTTAPATGTAPSTATQPATAEAPSAAPTSLPTPAITASAAPTDSPSATPSASASASAAPPRKSTNIRKKYTQE